MNIYDDSVFRMMKIMISKLMVIIRIVSNASNKGVDVHLMTKTKKSIIM